MKSPWKIAVIYVLALSCGSAFSVETRKTYILCNRDAEISVAKQSPVTLVDPCSGSVVLQGISYQCGPVSEVDSKRDQFLEDLKRNGRRFCEDYCRERGTLLTRCHGVFTEPNECGFTIPRSAALDFGRDMAPCNPECGGVAFAYCSIFHGSYLGTDLNLVKNNPPNCKCVSGSAEEP